MLKKYLDERMILSIVVGGVVLFLLQHYLTKKVFKDGKMSQYIGNDEVGYTKI